MSGECVEGSHVDDISCILGSKLGMAVSGGVRRIVGPVWVGEKAHWRRIGVKGWRGQEEEMRGTKKGQEEKFKVNVE
jgi:hypothetical protein